VFDKVLFLLAVLRDLLLSQDPLLSETKYLLSLPLNELSLIVWLKGDQLRINVKDQLTDSTSLLTTTSIVRSFLTVPRARLLKAEYSIGTAFFNKEPSGPMAL
jgi:hypothetical protein